jgi:hypothetical protein
MEWPQSHRSVGMLFFNSAKVISEAYAVKIHLAVI